MSSKIEIVNRGRGPQLSTSRVTVLDLVPYLQDGCSYDEIIRWIPTLSREEIAVVESYYRANNEALDKQDHAIQEAAGGRRNPPWVEEIAERARGERAAILEKVRQSKANGNAP